MTNRELAKLAQISEATVSRVLSTKGANASAATITAICGALDVRVEASSYEVVEPAPSIIDGYTECILSLRQQLKKEAREKRVLFFAFIGVVLFVFILFAVDLTNPTVGWFRS